MKKRGLCIVSLICALSMIIGCAFAEKEYYIWGNYYMDLPDSFQYKGLVDEDLNMYEYTNSNPEIYIFEAPTGNGYTDTAEQMAALGSTGLYDLVDSYINPNYIPFAVAMSVHDDFYETYLVFTTDSGEHSMGIYDGTQTDQSVQMWSDIVDSIERRLHVYILTDPSNMTANEGINVKFKVSADGDGLKYQWQFKKPGGSWTNSPATGNKTATLTVPATADRNGYQYRCKVTDKYGLYEVSSAATLTVKSLTITTQPASKTVTNGTTVKFTVAGTGEGLKYQWQFRTPGGSWQKSPATGNTTATLTVPGTTARNGNQYRCVITDKYGNKVTSSTATLKVTNLAISTQPASIAVSNGTTTKFTVVAKGDGLKYQWQFKTPGGSWQKSPATGNTTASLTVPGTTARNGNQYRCIVTDKYGAKVTSKAATLTVTNLSITTQPASKTVSNGTTTKFTVVAKGDGLKYQWQFKAPGASWQNSPATGNTTATLTMPGTTARNGNQYRCIVTDKYGAKVTSKAATLTVTNLSITTQPTSKTVKNGTTTKFTVVAKGSGLKYQWQFRTPGGSWQNSPATGNTTASLTVPGTTARNGNQYRCVVTDQYGAKVTSGAATLTVK